MVDSGLAPTRLALGLAEAARGLLTGGVEEGRWTLADRALWGGVFLSDSSHQETFSSRDLNDVIEECGQRQVKGAILLAAGFSEASEEGRVLETSEALESKVTTAEQNMLYCVQHGRMVKAEHGVSGLGHVQIDHTDTGDEVDFCCFPNGFATCPPPDVPDGDWAAQDEPVDEAGEMAEFVAEWRD